MRRFERETCHYVISDLLTKGFFVMTCAIVIAADFADASIVVVGNLNRLGQGLGYFGQNTNFFSCSLQLGSFLSFLGLSRIFLCFFFTLHSLHLVTWFPEVESVLNEAGEK